MKERDLDTGKEKVKKICDLLKKETLEPAHKEAEAILAEARAKSAQIVEEAHAKAEAILAEAHAKQEKEKALLQASLNQACKQSLDALKEEVETKLFSENLSLLIESQMQETKTIEALIRAFVGAIGEEGSEANFDIAIPKSVSAKEVNDALGVSVLKKLKNHSVSIGPMRGGITVQVVGTHLKVDATQEALKEWVSNYIRQDFRERILQG